MMERIDTQHLLRELEAHGMATPPDGLIEIKTPTAREDIRQVYTELLMRSGRSMVWRPEYDLVAQWLTDNRGRGLLLHGTCGTGKSFMARYVLPTILLARHNKVLKCFDAPKLGGQLAEVLGRKLLVIDDLGTESAYRDYGNLKDPVAELVDNAEKRGVLLVITTNLHLGEGKGGLLSHYDQRVIDRLLGLVTAIEFKGNSFRQ